MPTRRDLVKRYVHVWIGLGLFAWCLMLTGYYTGETREPQPSLVLLLIGWLGHIAWLANVFFVVALLAFRKPRTSSILGFIALGLSLSFLATDKVMVNEVPAYAPVTAYGWGYCLWVAAIGSYSTGQVLIALERGFRLRAAALSIWVAVVFGIFVVHYYVGDTSQFAVEVARNRVFEEKCRIAGQHVYRTAAGANGIFFDSHVAASFKRDDFGNWHLDALGGSGMGYVNSGLLLFYEERNGSGSESEYRRFVRGDHIGLETDRLQSEFAVITERFDIPGMLNIRGAQMTIKDLADQSILATTTYVFDPIGHKFCGYAPQGRFSPSRLIMETLNLAKKF